MTADSVSLQGFGRIPGVLPVSVRDRFLELLGDVNGAGRRGLLEDSQVWDLACSPALTDLVQPHLPQRARPVRAIYFDKSPDANWLVPWHQDLTLAVRQRKDVPGFGPWSVKEGVVHVQPPIPLLEEMLTIRLHFDDCDETNGALKVLPGTHLLGRLTPSDIQDQRAATAEVVCVMAAGDALLMRPLLLHASGRSASDRHRRVLHIEYAGFDLPAGLEWHEGARSAMAL